MVATAIIGSAVVGAGASVAGSMTQAKATSKASDSQMAMYDTTRGDLQPYNTAGQNALSSLGTRLDSLSQDVAPIKMDQATLEQTPGYQFNLSQGLKSVQNSAAARGLGSSGAALKGAGTFATGLADSTFQNQFNNSLSNANLGLASRQQSFNQLLGVSQLGESAGAQTGDYGTRTAQSVGQNTIAGGTAQAAGINGAASSLSNGVGNYLQYNAMQQNRGMYYPAAPTSYPY